MLRVADRRKEILLPCNLGDFCTKVMCFTFSICPSSGYWSRMDLNCWMSDGWIKSNPSSSLFAEQQIKKKTDIRGRFQRNHTQRPGLRNIRSNIISLLNDRGFKLLGTRMPLQLTSNYLIILVHPDFYMHHMDYGLTEDVSVTNA